MAEPLDAALARVRELLLDEGQLVRAVGAGKQRGPQPRWRRVELRYVDLKAGRHLQVTSFDATQAFSHDDEVTYVRGPKRTTDPMRNAVGLRNEKRR